MKIRIIRAVLSVLMPLSFSGLNLADENQFSKEYTYDNMSLFPSGIWTGVEFGKSYQDVEWKILNLAKSSFLSPHFISIFSVATPHQNSVVEQFQGEGLKGSEIYSFTNSGIDGSIAIKNTRNSLRISPIFVLKSGSYYNMAIGSDISKKIKFTQSYGIITMSQNTYELSDRSVNVNWADDSDLFHSGLIFHSVKSNVISLLFGPITLFRKETYTVDPLIKPMKNLGGGGGGGPGSSPVIGYFKMSNSYPSVFINGSQTFNLDLSIISMGSYKAAMVEFYIADPSYYYYQIGSMKVDHDGSYSVQIIPNYIGEWEQFGIAVNYDEYWDFQGSAGHSFVEYDNTECAYSYPNPDYVGRAMKPIYNSDGRIVGEIFGSVHLASCLKPSATSKAELMSGVATLNNDYEVNSMAIHFIYIGDTMGQTPQYLSNSDCKVQQYVYCSAYQNYKNNSWTTWEKILWMAAFSVASTLTDGSTAALFALGGTLNPFTFCQGNNFNKPQSLPMNLSYTQNAGVKILSFPHSPLIQYYYCPLGIKYDISWGGVCYKFKSSYLFQIGDGITVQAHDNKATTPYVVDFLQYTVVFSLLNETKDDCFNKFPNLYTGSYSVTVYLPEEVTKNA
ncbi:hypothetical protein ACNF40_06085 [Cuniculiplasma sp. SKW4]|uniref:hypothetical protein n=1 Tax=Cuniculiplasma sp. SKW4 TaxID=3400171 RepID=UPI003FD2ECFE